MNGKDVLRTIALAWPASARLLAVVLPVLVVGATRGVAQGEGSNSGDLSRRVRYDMDYVSTGSGEHTHSSHMLVLLTAARWTRCSRPWTPPPRRGKSMPPRRPAAVRITTRRPFPAEGTGTRPCPPTTPCGVLGRALHRPGGDTTLVVMGGPCRPRRRATPKVTGVATITNAVPRDVLEV